jgi:hypothetical protein
MLFERSARMSHEDREVPNRSSNESLLTCRTYVGELE